jgi:NADH-quinone oxidoreductase subunit L
LAGCLALAAIPPFAGFFSKDAILAAVEDRAAGPAGAWYHLLFVAAVFTAFLTAFYTFRAFFLTFYGEQRVPHEAHGHVHESPAVMTWPLVVLAAGALLVGAYFEWTHGFAHFLAQTPSLAHLERTAATAAPAAEAVSHTTIALASVIVGLLGIGLAALLYLGRPAPVNRLARLMEFVGLYQLSAGKFFMDTINNVLVVWPLEGIAWLCAWLDRGVIDGLVNAIGRAPIALGSSLRSLEGGRIQFYALGMVLGVLVLIGLLLL